MRIYDYDCPACGILPDVFAETEEIFLSCPHCGAESKRIISVSGQYTGNQDAGWLRSVLDVVDRENPARHVQEFVRNPSRENYKRWMKGEKIAPVDYTIHGAPPVYERNPEPDMSQVRREVLDNHFKRKGFRIS